MVSRSSSSPSTTTSSATSDERIAADGEAIVARAEGGDVIVNQTADEAFDLGETALLANTDAIELALRFADDQFYKASESQLEGLDYATRLAANSLDTVSQGFEQALAESREDTTQLLSQVIKFGIPAAIIVFYIAKRA